MMFIGDVAKQWKSLPQNVRTGISMTLKLGLTIVAFYVLFTHPVTTGDGEQVAIYEAIMTYLPEIKARQFWFWCILAGLVKLVGVVFSAWGWHMLLKGQGVVFPFWRQIMTTWLIGRFIGTFLPSTIGLDGYTLYDAGRYSRQWERVTVAKALEKFIGVTGLFLCMLVLLPFGIGIFGERALLMGGIVGGVALSVVVAVFLGTFRPGILQFFLRLPFPFRSRIET
ncbi:MAG: lysylphosphatidylglycerol synthase domain-containing protein, partial [Myxococcota bacterium]